LYISIVRG
jgi:hypothetical protein